MWTKNKRARVKIFFEALAVVLLMHLLLLVLFRSPRTNQIQEAPRTNRISMLPRNSAKFDRQAFEAWLEYADPTLIARPDERYGYGLLVAPGGLRQSFMTADPAMAEIRFDFSRKVARPNIFPRSAKLDRAHELPEFNYPLPEQKTVITFPLVISDEGKMIQGLFAGMETEKAIGNGNITSPTIIKISQIMNEPSIPRFMLLKSCGSTELDRLAIRAIVAGMNFINGKTGDMLLNVYWKPEDEADK